MAAEPEVFDELRRLRARVPHLTGSLAASVDGLVLAQDTGGVEPEGVAALTAAALGVARRLVEATGQGAFRELVLRGEDGYVATYAAGPTAVLTVLAEPRANVGRLHLEARRSGASIARLAEGAAGGDRTPGATGTGTGTSRASGMGASARAAKSGANKGRSTSNRAPEPATPEPATTAAPTANAGGSREGEPLPVRRPRTNTER